MSSLALLSLLQLVVAAVGVWSKLRSGFGLVEVPSPARLIEPGCWLEDLGGLIPFAIMVEMISPVRKLRAVSLLGLLSAILGFAAAMPALSLWILQAAEHKALSRRQRSVLGKLAFLSAVTHVGAFVVALSTACLGLDSSPWHVMNSLLSGPDHPGRLPEKALREARLRQINEMTGTSSGFFMAAGLLLLRLEIWLLDLRPEVRW
ncbi:IdtS [Ophiocordyceps camponoti-floridani]|uniref:IdtS n=1 Tax=Ophiocordyceps camponoti-floridani TaxID=2030778 RepID=A0A8H4Q4J8_9HYPO|nr:IdtS [Ophiocordyceps camponoti-floridani]